MYKLDFEEAEETRDWIANISWIIEKQGNSSTTSVCFNDCTKISDCVDHNKLWKILKEMEIPDSPASWEIYLQTKKHQLEPDMV